MPVEFDPAWEYRVDDPELSPPLSHGFAGLGVEDRRLDRAGVLVGFRFGAGNPDAATFRRRRGSDFVADQGLDLRQCAGCRSMFLPDRASRKHCSNACYRRPGRERELPESLPCTRCGTGFKPKYANQRYCGRRCGGATSTRESRFDHKQLAGMWVTGASLGEIATALGCSVVTVKKLRRKLGLSPRPAGNHSVARMKATVT